MNSLLALKCMFNFRYFGSTFFWSSNDEVDFTNAFGMLKNEGVSSFVCIGA